jgi:2-hydroxy-3-oxopropionate reductase
VTLNHAANDATSVAFIGLGAMGRPMADCIVRAGYRVLVYDISAEAAEKFAGRAEIARSPADAASRADVVIGCLPTLAAYREAILGPQGIARGTRASTYIHVGTTGSAMVKEFADALRKSDRVVIDAPMTGGPARARSGTLTVMASGPERAFLKAEPVLRCYASRVVYFGEQAGAAQTMKIVNNILYGASLIVAAEGLALGAKAGLDPKRMLEVINSGSGQSWVTSEMVPTHILPRTFDFGAAMALLIKDLTAVMDEAKMLRVPMPAAAAVYQAFINATAKESDRDDVTDIFRYVERAAGVQIPKS